MHTLPFVCFACRKSFKVTWSGFSPGKDNPKVLLHRCPQCAGQLLYMGRYFKAPPTSAMKQWRKVALLYPSGWRADDLTGGPKSLSEVRDFLRNLEARTVAAAYRERKRSEAEKAWRRARRRRRDF